MSAFSDLLAQDVMSTPVLSTSTESSVDQLEREFVRHGVSATPVVEHRQIVGIISRSFLMLLPVLWAAIESWVLLAVWWQIVALKRVLSEVKRRPERWGFEDGFSTVVA